MPRCTDTGSTNWLANSINFREIIKNKMGRIWNKSFEFANGCLLETCPIPSYRIFRNLSTENSVISYYEIKHVFL